MELFRSIEREACTGRPDSKCEVWLTRSEKFRFVSEWRGEKGVEGKERRREEGR